MPKQQLGVSEEQVGKAVDALFKFLGKQADERKSLVEDDEMFYLVRANSLWLFPVSPASNPRGTMLMM